MKKIVIILLFLCSFSGISLAQNPTFETQASSTDVAVGEPFRILFTISNASQISGFDPPEFKGFQVLQNSQSQSISIINGQTSRKLSYVFILQATAVGRFTIHGATARLNGNTVHSNPITLTVSKGGSGGGNPGGNGGFSPRSQSAPPPGSSQPHLSPSMQRRLNNQPAIIQKGQDPMEKIKKNVFVRVDVDKKDVYAGQQITAKYRLFTRLPTSSKVVKVPSFSGFSTHDLPVASPLRPELTEVDGKQYRVFTFRKTMLFPLQTGWQKLEPVEIENEVKLYTLEKSEGGQDPFNGFFNDPFFKDMFDDPFFQQAFGGGMQLLPHDYSYNMSSPVVKIHVKPLPEEGKPAGFDNAVGSFSIQSKVDKTQLTTDGAVTLTVTIKGTGNVNLLSAPQIDFPDNLESYDPKVSDNFNNTNPFGGSRSFAYVLMPKSAGTIVIPAVDFSYFDPQSGSYKTVHTQPHTLKVSQGETAKGAAGSAASGPSKNTLVPIRTGALSWSLAAPWLGSWWHWVLMLLPLVTLLLLLWLKRRRDRLNADQILLKHKKANKVALKRLSLARKYLKQNKSKPFYEEISHAIWGYLCDKLNIPLAELTKQKAEDKLKEKQINGGLPKELFGLLDRCEMALYAGISGHEHMADTYNEALKIIGALDTQLKKKRQA